MNIISSSYGGGMAAAVIRHSVNSSDMHRVDDDQLVLVPYSDRVAIHFYDAPMVVLCANRF
jgi:hypothetical protein